MVVHAWIVIEVINILHKRNNSQTEKYMTLFNKVLPDRLIETMKLL